MYGAIIGDIVGSKYEFGNIKTKDFPLFSDGCSFTDDTVMTVAAAKAILNCHSNGSEFHSELVKQMKLYGKRFPFPKGGYGARFNAWLSSEDPAPYKSYGNGSAMRVSPCGLYADTLEGALTLAKASAEVTHNHPEGIKGAQAVAAAIFMAKTGSTKEQIKKYTEDNFYSLDFTLDEIRPYYRFDETCQGTVPQAIAAFVESCDFEDAIRNAVSLGGDSDTLAAITGSVAWSYYRFNGGITGRMQEILAQAKYYLPEDFIGTAEQLYEAAEQLEKT